MECTDASGARIVYTHEHVQDFHRSKLISICGIIVQGTLFVLTFVHLYKQILKVRHMWRTVIFHALLIATLTFDLLQYLQTFYYSLYFCQQSSPTINFWSCFFLSRSSFCAALIWTARSWSRVYWKVHSSSPTWRIKGVDLLTGLYALQFLSALGLTVRLCFLTYDHSKEDGFRNVVTESRSYLCYRFATTALKLSACGTLSYYAKKLSFPESPKRDCPSVIEFGGTPHGKTRRRYVKVNVVLAFLCLLIVLRAIVIIVFIHREFLFWSSRSNWWYMTFVHYIPNCGRIGILLWLHGLPWESDEDTPLEKIESSTTSCCGCSECLEFTYNNRHLQC